MDSLESRHQAAEDHERAAARYERLAFHSMRRGDLHKAALARRQARLHLQTVLLELRRASRVPSS